MRSSACVILCAESAHTICGQPSTQADMDPTIKYGVEVCMRGTSERTVGAQTFISYRCAEVGTHIYIVMVGFYQGLTGGCDSV